ncbi:unnamed protein product, partial [Mesorhabditis spiculigera]
MPTLTSIAKDRVAMYIPAVSTCQCHKDEPPPWTGEIHGLSQALMSESIPLRAFWWLMLVMCIICGVTTTTLVVLEYIEGPTQTSTTIRLVDSLELPGITICPKVPDIFDEEPLFRDISASLPNLTYDVQLDVVRYFIAGNGLENIDAISRYNASYLQQLDLYYRLWSRGYSTQEFFYLIHDKYGYTCEQFFYSCNFGGNAKNCCTEVFAKKIVIRRGVCFQTRAALNQTEADDVGRLVLSMRALRTMTSPEYNYTQPQLLVYVTDNHDIVSDEADGEVHGTHPEQRRVHKQVVRKRRRMRDSTMAGLPAGIEVCDPAIIVENYYNHIQLVWDNANVTENCIPGCKRWDYTVSLQQNPNIDRFIDYAYNLEVSYNDLQYEYVKESYTTSVPGFMSQIGGQFGFFLGLSIITFLQMLIYCIHWIAVTVASKMHRIYRTFSSVTASEKPTSYSLPNLPYRAHHLDVLPGTEEPVSEPGTVRSDSWELQELKEETPKLAKLAEFEQDVSE